MVRTAILFPQLLPPFARPEFEVAVRRNGGDRWAKASRAGTNSSRCCLACPHSLVQRNRESQRRGFFELQRAGGRPSRPEAR